MSVLSGSGGFFAGVAVAALVAILVIVIRLDNYCQYIYLYYVTQLFYIGLSLKGVASITKMYVMKS